eukprot:TRINITY_DN1935_c0_g1_i2.p1 TRINITY_DN1935_c0_g1~~TRINITY_DN1935_c0_g1_i2.p1  ORF type:complete len:682 (+),score=111.43 TRINITY_DN1935_c0_g1_i2:256-2301(+)
MPDGTHCHILPGMGKQLLQQLPKLAREVSQAVTRYQQVAEAAAGVCANVVSPKAVADVISGECPVFVLDTNESMKGMRFHQLRCCCVGLLDKLRGTGRRFSILTYDPKVKCEGMADGRGGESVREEHVKTVTQAQDWVLKLKLGGGVTIMDSLMIAMSAPQGDAVYFLTYGFGNERAFMRVRDLVRDATQPLCVEVHSAPRDKSVHTVALDANVKSKEWLGEIADSGKGIAYVCDTESAEKALEDAGIDISLFKRDDLQLLQDEAADATSQCEKIHRLQRELRTELDRIIWGTMVLHNGRDAPNETDALITSLDKVFAVDGSPAPLSPAGQSPSRDEWLRSSGCPAQLVSQMRSLFQMLDEQHRGFLCRDNLGGVFDIIEKDWPEHEAAHLAEAAWAPDGRMLFDGFLRFFLEFLDCNFRHIDSSRNGLILSSRDAELVSTVLTRNHAVTMQRFGGVHGSVPRSEFPEYVVSHCMSGMGLRAIKHACGALALLRCAEVLHEEDDEMPSHSREASSPERTRPASAFSYRDDSDDDVPCLTVQPVSRADSRYTQPPPRPASAHSHRAEWQSSASAPKRPWERSRPASAKTRRPASAHNQQRAERPEPYWQSSSSTPKRPWERSRPASAQAHRSRASPARAPALPRRPASATKRMFPSNFQRQRDKKENVSPGGVLRISVSVPC